MSPDLAIAASLSPDVRQDIGIQGLSRSRPISHIAAMHQVSQNAMGMCSISSTNLSKLPMV